MHDHHTILHCIERGDAIGAHAAMTNHLVHVEWTLLQKQLGMSQKKPGKKPNRRKRNQVVCALSRAKLRNTKSRTTNFGTVFPARDQVALNRAKLSAK